METQFRRYQVRFNFNEYKTNGRFFLSGNVNSWQLITHEGQEFFHTNKADSTEVCMNLKLKK